MKVSKLTPNRLAMIRSYLDKGFNCDACYPINFQLINFVIQENNKDTLPVMKNVIVNRVNVMKCAIKHYEKAIEIISNIEKK